MTSEKLDLAGKVSIVTGASCGNGEAIGITLAKAGTKVTLAARRVDKQEDVKRKIEELGGVCIQVKTDVAFRNDGFPGLAVYTGSKFFMEGFSETLRQEVCKFGIRVTVVQPGSVNVSDMTDKHIDPEETESGKSLEQEDIANAVLYAVTQPDYVGVNEILIQPRDMPF